jgi:hypothetical protein
MCHGDSDGSGIGMTLLSHSCYAVSSYEYEGAVQRGEAAFAVAMLWLISFGQ